MAAKEVEVKVDTEKLQRAMKQAPMKLFHLLRTRVGGKTGYLHKWVRREIAGKKFARGGMSGGNLLHRRTGQMSRSFDTETHGTNLGNLRVITGTVNGSVPYAAIHEFGGTIRASRTKYLAIPLDAAKTAAGVPRGRPRDFPNTFIRNTGKGPIIFQKLGRRVVPLFALKTSVDIPARLGFYDAFEKQMPALVREFNRAIDLALEEDKRGVTA